MEKLFIEVKSTGDKESARNLEEKKQLDESLRKYYGENQIVEIQPTHSNLWLSFIQILQHLSSCLTSQYVEGSITP